MSFALDDWQVQLPNYCSSMGVAGYPENANAEGVEKLHRWTVDGRHDLPLPATWRKFHSARYSLRSVPCSCRLRRESHHVRMRPISGAKG